MICPRCQAANQEGRRFCGRCGGRLPRACPACGFANDAGDRFCGGCGAALVADPPRGADAALAADATRGSGAATARPPATAGDAGPAAPASYTPAHLARKILDAQATLEGERKHVTVLFADLKGSMELLADRDPEEARAILDPVLDRMMEAVHRYEGTVNQVLGDGIMALFGAPVAHEDHALRACYAAIAMQESVRRLADEARRAHGVPVRIRVGLHSGEVVVRAIGNDLHMDYSAVGQTTHLAARMEQAAEPGTTRLTADTLALVEGRVEVKHLGAVAVKGLAEPVETFTLVGVGPMRSRLEAAAARGLSRFVGREQELATLRAALERASRGQGSAVALVGDPGVGKSRIIHELLSGDAVRGWLVIEGGAVAHGRATPYLPIVDLLRHYFRLEPGDSRERVREVVTRRMLGLDPALVSSLTPVLALLGAAEEDSGWHDLDPGQRRQQTLLAIQRLSVRESRSQPLLVVMQDLQWADSETQAVLDGMLSGLPTVRVVLVLAWRPEYRPPWPAHPHVVELAIEPLAPPSAGALLDALLGGDASLAPLERMLVERTQGNPLFIEESVRTLAEMGVLEGGPGAFRLVKPLPDVHVPPTVHAVLASRIDRLSPEDKHVLQCAAVVGSEVPLTLVTVIADEPEDEVRRALDRLRAAGFLDEKRLFPALEYAFRHALTHDVAYQSLLHERRRTLHACIVRAIVERHAGRLDEHVERLAHHALRGEQWEDALRYLRRAGDKAAAHSAHREAAARFEEALAAARHLPETAETLGQAADLRLALRNALFLLGELPGMFEHLAEAEALAERLGDRVRLGRISAALTNSLWAVGDPRRALEAGRRTLALAEALGDEALGAVGHQYVGQAHHALGDYEPAIAHLRSAVGALAGGDASQLRVGMVGPPAIFSRAWLVWCLAERGDFDEAQRRVAEALEIATASEQLYSVAQANFAAGMLAMFQGELPDAVAAFEHSRGLCEAGNLQLTLAMTEVPLGHAYGLLGWTPEALAVLTRATARCEAVQFRYPHCLGLIWSAEAFAQAGQTADARRLAGEALDRTRTMGARGLEARATRMLGDVQAAAGEDAAARRSYEDAIALAGILGMRPFAERCRLDLGRLHARAGRREAARAALGAAIDGFRALGMKHWVERAERELAGV